MQKKETEFLWRSTTVGEKEVMLYDRIALERHVQKLHELNDFRTRNFGFFV